MIKSGFFNSVNNDRTYSAEDMNKPYSRLISNGVIPYVSSSLQVIYSTAMQVSVKPGAGLFGDGWAENDADIVLTVDAAHSTLNRKDLVVIARNIGASVRATTVYIKKGTAATTPNAPTVTRSDTLQEYALAEIYVGKGVTSLSQSVITDTRPDKTRCGWTTGLINQVDTTTLFNQWQTAGEEFFETEQEAFDAWFNSIKDTLATATLIRQYTSKYTVTSDNTSVIPIAIPQYNSALDILQVYVNGWKLVYNVDYTANDTHITLNNSLNTGAIVSVEIFKSIDGSDAESIINDVVELQNKVNALESNVYYCNGANDNVELKSFINTFLLDSSKDTIKIVGEFGVNATKTNASDNNSYSFAFEDDSDRGLTLDFSDCEIIQANGNFIFTKNVNVKNCSVNYNSGTNDNNVIAFGGDGCHFENCKVTGSIRSGESFAFSGTSCNYEHCETDLLNNNGNIYGISGSNLMLSNCNIIVSGNTSAYGVSLSNGGRAINCNFKGTTSSAATTVSGNGAIGGGYFSNCLFEGFGGLKGHGFYIRTGLLLEANNCVFRGYTKNTSSGLGVGITGGQDTSTTMQLFGINCNQVTVSNYSQTGTMYFTAGTGIIAGCFYATPTIPTAITGLAVYNRNRV